MTGNGKVVRATHSCQCPALTRANRSIALLGSSRRALLRATTLQQLLDDVCCLAVEQGGYRLAWLGRPKEDDTRTVRPVAQAGPGEGYLDEVRISWAENDKNGLGPTGLAIRGDRPVSARFILSDPIFEPWRQYALAYGFQSCIALPLRVGDRIWGVLVFYAAEPDAFDEAETRLLEEVADDLAFGISTLCLRRSRDAAEEKLRRSAYTDLATGLPNRASLMESLDDALSRSERGALLFIDLDRFKEVSDTQGHIIGDRVLRAAGERLSDVIEGGAMLARTGDGEFVLVIPDADETAAATLAMWLIRLLGKNFRVEGSNVSLGARIGIALYPDGKETPSEIFAHAGLASRASLSSGNFYRFYSPHMSFVLTERLEIAEALQRAVSEGGLLLHYQPKTDMRSGQLVGAEALLRWEDPVRGAVSPGRFIPIAEERGLMPELGLWVLNEACRQLAAWRGAGLRFPGKLAVNVSSRQLEAPDFVSAINAIVGAQDCSPAELELEITESVMANDVGGVIAKLEEIKAMGFACAIDDFGTGFSSLAYLSQLPAETLKIDISFVRNMLKSASDYLIVETIIGMAKNLGLTTVAEGVETEEQLHALVALGCPVAQGYYFGRPESPESFAQRWLAAP